MSPKDILVDARGHRCPIPTLRLRKALASAPAGARVTLLADDPMARVDVPHFASQAGVKLLETRSEGSALAFTVEASGVGTTD
jgi:tRNA 2-thiouridine synthesizing protein A